jgi:cellulose synthase/poly-beta-1,6-N-acetylglucosamine synthase-like glycosyltransferase
VSAIAVIFWVSSGLILWTHLGYPLLLWLLTRGRDSQLASSPTPLDAAREVLPRVSLVIAAHDEEAVIAARVANALALDYPRELLEVIVASDGSTDRTVELARAAGADQVLDLERAGKLLTQNAGVEAAKGDILAFSDANATWHPDALHRLVSAFEDFQVGYACGQVRFTGQGGSNQEGAYWRLELAIRGMESNLAGITAGNGAIYAVRRSAYVPLGPASSHDLVFPFLLHKRGLRSTYVPDAIAEEKMVASNEGEFARKRRMMRGIYDEVVGDGMISPRGYRPLYALEIFSHRLIRYATPFLHVIAFAANIALLGDGWVYTATLAAQIALLAAAALAPVVESRLLRLAQDYVLTTASIALGLFDRIRFGTPGAWEQAEGTR